MRQLTIRNVSEDLARALKSEQHRRGGSLNQLLLDLLRRALGVAPEKPYDNGLGVLAGTWTAEELAAMAQATAMFEQVDEELWQ